MTKETGAIQFSLLIYRLPLGNFRGFSVFGSFCLRCSFSFT